ncbi:MAG: hypothetical protein IPG22_20910 [Acidobacteria bacterium]|nr:hypothetical protein [Acidobacteriota bacterium]
MIRNIISSGLLACCLVFSASVINAQWGNEPVIVYDLTNGRGTSQGFNVGEYRNDRRQLGSLGNDRASSVYVAQGYTVRLCEAEGQNGAGRCEQYGQGYHNLLYSNTASYIQVTGGWGGGGGSWGGGNQGSGGVTVYDDRDFRGASQVFGPGRYLNNAGQLGSIRNDEASSVIVERGYKVRFCEGEGTGRGSGRCEELGEGRFNLRLNDEASYIEVQRTGGWGGGGAVVTAAVITTSWLLSTRKKTNAATSNPSASELFVTTSDSSAISKMTTRPRSLFRVDIA